MSQSSLKATLATTLGAVTTAAQSVGSIFDTIGGGVSMVNRYVQTASEKQVIATDYEMADYEENLLATVSIERTRMNREIVRFLDEDPLNRAEYVEVQAKLQEAVAARRAARTQGAGRPRLVSTSA
jgi:hypothetical protein